jgi:hypothetical protein
LLLLLLLLLLRLLLRLLLLLLRLLLRLLRLLLDGRAWHPKQHRLQLRWLGLHLGDTWRRRGRMHAERGGEGGGRPDGSGGGGRSGGRGRRGSGSRRGGGSQCRVPFRGGSGSGRRSRMCHRNGSKLHRPVVRTGGACRHLLQLGKILPR